jgi:hypothetical protein
LRIVVDINHPAHVHYFKNFIWIMQKRGHELLITATQKEVSYNLLDGYGFQYKKLGSYGTSILEKLVNIPILDWKMFETVKSFKPDLFLGFGSIRAAHASKLLGKPCINFDDSEPSPQEHLLYVPFSEAVLTPSCFRKDLGKKHRRYDGYIELTYLHPKYFTPDPSVLEDVGISPGEKYTLARFVSWRASHDIGRHGIEDKLRTIKELEKYGRVFISSEKKLDNSLESYKIKIRPDKLHSLLSYSSLLVCDGQTMTTEAALLGIPAVRCNTFVGESDMGNFLELEKKYNLIYNFNSIDRSIEKINELLQIPDIMKDWRKKQEIMLKEKIDVTGLMVYFIENFPESMNKDEDTLTHFFIKKNG